MTTLRERHTATYSYPGMLFAETTSRSIPEPTFDAALAAGPHEEGYFSKDGWYAVEISTTTEKLFKADDGEETWVAQGREQQVGNWIIGDRYHFTEIEQTDRNRILISNIERNSRDGGYGVLTRCGNWQIASDYTAIVSSTEATG